MNAREQARNEALALHQQAEYRPFPGQYADAASDIWEPLLRDLLEAYMLRAAGLPLTPELKGVGTRSLLALGKDPHP